MDVRYPSDRFGGRYARYSAALVQRMLALVTHVTVPRVLAIPGGSG